MVHDSVKHFEKVLKILEIVGNMSGTYLPDLETSTPNCFARFKKFYVVFVVLLVLLLVVGSAPYVLEHWENTIEVTQSLTFAIAASQCVVKIVLFIYYKSDIFDLIQKAKYFRSVNISSEKEQKISEKSTKKSLHSALGFLIMYLMVFVPSAIAPLTQEDKLLPIPVQIPFASPFKSPFYEINYVHQVLAVLYYLTSIAVSDAVYVVLINEGCLQLDIIAEKLSHIGEDSDGDENEEEDLKLLRGIHILHTAVNKYFYKINQIFSLMLLVQFFTSTYGISFGIFCSIKVWILTYATKYYFIATGSQLTSFPYLVGVALQSDKIVTLVAYAFQIYVLTFHGEQTKLKMANILQALYTNKWYNLGPKTKKSLIIMMSCSQPQFQLSAGGFIDLTLRTFLAIMKTAYSYYALMNST